MDGQQRQEIHNAARDRELSSRIEHMPNIQNAFVMSDAEDQARACPGNDRHRLGNRHSQGLGGAHAEEASIDPQYRRRRNRGPESRRT